MLNKFFFAVTTTFLFLLFQSRPALAQSDPPKLELGAQYTLIRSDDTGTTDSGVGGRIGYNLTKHVGIEGEINFFPQKRPVPNNGFYIDSRKVEGLFGVKVGHRTDKVGVFGKLRPGFLFISEGRVNPEVVFIRLPTPPTSQTEFALDFGGVLEFYPSRHTLLRFDLGDTVVHFSKSSISSSSFTTHNLQLSMGVGFRF